VLRLRHPLAEAFAELGLQGEDRWRAAARVRVVLGQPGWPAIVLGAPRAAADAPPAALDPDVAWLIGVHEHAGTRYFVKEGFESLLWWTALPALLAAGKRAAVRALERDVAARSAAAAAAGYRLAS
jgi:hypothetical protein